MSTHVIAASSLAVERVFANAAPVLAIHVYAVLVPRQSVRVICHVRTQIALVVIGSSASMACTIFGCGFGGSVGFELVLFQVARLEARVVTLITFISNTDMHTIVVVAQSLLAVSHI